MSVVLWRGGTGGTAVVTLPRAAPRIEMAGPTGAWLDITPHWRSDTPIVVTYGIQGNDPTDRVASTGTLEWDADNGARPGNSLGWTSAISKGLPGWRLGVPIRFSIGEAVGARQYKFQGGLAVHRRQRRAAGPLDADLQQYGGAEGRHDGRARHQLDA